MSINMASQTSSFLNLAADIQFLEKQPFPKYRKPKELAIFSTKLKHSEDDYEDQDGHVHNNVEHKEARAADAVTQIQIGGHNIALFMMTNEICTQIHLFIECSPYDVDNRFDDGLIVVVQKLNDVYYMHEFPTDSAIKKEGLQTEHQKLMQYWGMKFESYVTAKPAQQPKVDEPLNFNNEFGSIVYTKLNSHSMMFGGEVDCCHPNDTKKYIELKTTKQFEHARQESSFRRFKLIKWWLQSFLIGIDDILCGYRDDNGIIRHCEWYRIADIPHLLKKDPNYCKPSVCFAFLNMFLDFIKCNVQAELKPHVFIRQPKDNQFLMKVDETGHYKFLPYWFVAEAIGNKTM
ncbi:DXO [Bugula neritina]|uniref:Decapping nuclease n=1 Tax=Bugula neritina TaxID=10212 RepID=A0A7J7J135_BUGNE|nr:DXO [Bugula neritina]